MPAPARILIVSNGPLCRNPRVLKEATTLGAAGYTVTVLTVRHHLASEKQDVALLVNAPFRRVAVDMLPGLDTANAVVFRRRAFLWAMRKIAHFPGTRFIHSLGPAGPLLRAARRQSADLVIVHNEIAHWVGTKLLNEGRSVAADFEDWHSEDLLPETRARRPLRQLRTIEHQLLRRARYTSTTSHALADGLHARYDGHRPIILTNSFPLQAEPARPPNTPPAFFWFSQTLGPGRGLELFFAAWIRTKHPSRVVLLGESTPGYQEKLLREIPAERRTFISFLPLVPPAELPALVAQHDIGLALEESSIVNRDLTITNKILQYLNAGLAIVASSTAGQREVLARAGGAGVLVDTHDQERFAAALDSFLDDPAVLARQQVIARRAAIEIFCWEREAPKLLAAVSGALGHSDPK
jgi:glycosyltransferase involved in cell wall biosynthesis